MCSLENITLKINLHIDHVFNDYICVPDVKALKIEYNLRSKISDSIKNYGHYGKNNQLQEV